MLHLGHFENKMHWETFTYNIIIRFQGNLEDITLLCLNKEEEHVLSRKRKQKKLDNFIGWIIV